MHQADRSGLAGAAGDPVALRVDDAVIHGAGEHTVMPVRIQGSLVTSRNDFERAVFGCYIVDEQQACDHVVIGHRLEQEILMPFYRGTGSGKFGIHLAVMEADIGPDQLRAIIHYPRGAHDIFIDVRDLFRRLDPPQPGPLGAVAGLQVEARPPVERFAIILGMRPALLDPARKDRSQLLELLIRHCVLDDKDAVIPEGVSLRL